MTDTVSYRPKTSEIPTQPGVYRFRDTTGRVLYVGKAKSLRARLTNYFQPLASLHERTRRMVTSASSVEWTVVGSELEALQLEFTWIKEFDPPFNVQFRDDKSYPYLAFTLGDDVPRVFITRTRGMSGARYFGPYTKVWAIRETLDVMLKAFPMRSCSPGVYRRAELTHRPCLLGDIGKCSAPCVGRVTTEEHRAIAQKFVSFMSGNELAHIHELRERMQAASDALDFETAAGLRDSLQALETAISKSAVVLSDALDVDAFGIAADELAAAVQQFIVRGGRIRGVRSWVVDKELDIDMANLVETVLQKAYGDGEEPPREILVPALPDDAGDVETWLETLRTSPGRVSLHLPQRGEKAALNQTAAMNAVNALALYKTRRRSDFVARSNALADIQEALGMAEAPLRMECFDISHLSGTNIVASMVVFEDGLPTKNQYRRFVLPVSRDDTDSIYQTLTRRLAHLRDGPGSADVDSVQRDAEADLSESNPPQRKKFSYPPNLLLVDGGAPQVAAAHRALVESGVTNIQLAGIAKRLEELWLPEQDYPVILPRNSDALFMIQHIRDEAHRFAITHQRTRRKRDISSQLHDIPGLGPARVTALLKHFGSVAHLRSASAESIAEVSGIGPVLAETIREHVAASVRSQPTAERTDTVNE